MKKILLAFLVLFLNNSYSTTTLPFSVDTVSVNNLKSKSVVITDTSLKHLNTFLYIDSISGKIKAKVFNTLSSDPKIINTTFNNLKSLKSHDSLIPYTYYAIMDFQTIYDQAITGLTKTSDTEIIIIQALTNNILSKKAFSLDYPSDVIHYDITMDTTYINGNACKGKIIYREEPSGNMAYFDFRKVLMYNSTSNTDSLIFGDGGGNKIINQSRLDKAIYGQEFPNSIFYNASFMNSNNSFINSFFKGATTYNNDNRFVNSTFENELSDVSSSLFSNTTIDGEIYKVTNTLFSNTTIDGGVNTITNSELNGINIQGDIELVTTSLISNSSFNNDVSKVNGTNFNNTTVGNKVDRLFNCAFLTDTIAGRLYWSNGSIVFNSYVDGNEGFQGINNIHFQNFHVEDCSILSMGGISMLEGYTGFHNVAIIGDISTDYISNVVVECYVENKVITKADYPILFNNKYSKHIIQGSNGLIYLRYFNGTIDVIIEII